MNSKIYNITDIGNIEICKHHNTKRLTIKLKPGGVPRVVIPKLMTYEMGFRFAVEKKEWIIKHAQQLNKKQRTIIYDQNSSLKTQVHTITIKLYSKSSIKALKSNSEVEIFIPESSDIGSDKIQDSIVETLNFVINFFGIFLF